MSGAGQEQFLTDARAQVTSVRRKGILSGQGGATVRRVFSDSRHLLLRRYPFALACMVVAAAATGATVTMLRAVVDGLPGAGEGVLVLLPLAIGGLFVVRGLATFGSAVIVSRIGNALVASLRKRLGNKILALPVRSVEAIHSGELLTSMSRQTIAARDVFDRIANGFVRDLLNFVVLVAILVWLNPLLSLVVLTAAVPAIMGTRMLARRSSRSAHAGVRALSGLGRVLQDTVSGIREVRAFNLEASARQQFHTVTEEIERRSNRVGASAALVSPVIELVAAVVVTTILLLAVVAVTQQGSSPGSFIAFLVAALLAYAPGLRLARLRVQIAGPIAEAGAVYEILDLPEPAVREGLRPLPEGPGRIVFDRVDFDYDPARPLFRGLSFVVEPGQKTALVGLSGGGKSTVMALIAGLIEPSGGRILIDGHDLAGLDLASVRQSIATVPQDLRFFGGTVRENIRLGRIGASDAEVEAAAEAALADEFIRKLPAGYDTELAEGGVHQLSGGQRQRLAIARALLRDAPIVLLDEATSALDAESEHRVQQAIDRLSRHRTTVVVAHRLATIRSAARVLVFEDGAIVEQGRHDELLAKGGRYAVFHQLQFGLREQS